MAAPTALTGPENARQRVWFRLLAGIALPLLFLLLLEAGLRLAGYGYNPDFFQSRRTSAGKVWINNPDFGRRFFPPGLVRSAQPFTFPVLKGPKTLRVFVLGESAAMGDPDFKFGLPRMLEVLLREHYPGRKIEVINAAVVAINSHVILPIARDCAKRQGDLWVIYMGNNEIIGPFGSASVFGARAPALALVRAIIRLKTLRLGQLFDAAVRSLRRGAESREWGGMEMMADQKVRHDSPATQRVYRHFERNLSDLLAVAGRAGVPVVLCTVATNLKDCAPFASLHTASLAVPELAEWDSDYKAGATFQSQGNLKEAEVAYEHASRIDSEFAELAFRQGDCARVLGQDAEAAAHYQQARDRDALQFRADSQINKIIRTTATAFNGRGVVLVDAENIFATNSPHALVGNQFFYEHVHLRPEGNYLLARAVAEQAARLLSPSLGDDWVSQSECWRLLGLADWNRYDALNTILDRIQGAPFINQLNHAEQLQTINEQLARYRLATKPAQVHRQASQVAELVARDPQDPDLRWNLAALLESAGENQASEEQWRVLMNLQPQSALPVYNLAKLLDSIGRQSDALPLYSRCLQLDPQSYAARYGLGALLLRMGHSPQAIRHLKMAVRQKPGSVEAHMALAQAFGLANHPSDAEKQWQEVLRLDPNNPNALERLHATTPATP